MRRKDYRVMASAMRTGFRMRNCYREHIMKKSTFKVCERLGNSIISVHLENGTLSKPGWHVMKQTGVNKLKMVRAEWATNAISTKSSKISRDN
jgi:hypothetical protein